MIKRLHTAILEPPLSRFNAPIPAKLIKSYFLNKAGIALNKRFNAPIPAKLIKSLGLGTGRKATKCFNAPIPAKLIKRG